MSGIVMSVIQKGIMPNIDCPVCKLIKGSTLNGKKCNILFETRDLIILEPLIKTVDSHLVVVTRKHTDQKHILDSPKIFKNIHKKVNEFFPGGWRLIINYGRKTLQTEQHAHIHIIGNQNLKNIRYI